MKPFRMLNKIIEFVVLTLVVLLCSALARATTVTGTLVDPTGQVLSNGKMTVEFAPAPGTTGSPSIPTQNINLDNVGAFSITLTGNDTIFPSKSTYSFTICPNATVQCFVIKQVSITGSSINISSVLNSGISNLSVNAQTLVPKAYKDSEVPIQDLLNTGALYWNVTDRSAHIWDGTVWSIIPSPSNFCNLMGPANVRSCFNVQPDWNGTTGTDNLASLQTALDSGRELIFPQPGILTNAYMFNGTLTMHEFGQRMFGTNTLLTRLVNINPTVPAILIAKPTTSHPEISLSTSEFGAIEKLTVEGSGASSTADCISVTGDGSSHSGDYFSLRDVRARFCNNGLEETGFGMLHTDNIILQNNNNCGFVYNAGSSNSATINGINTNNNSVCGMLLNGGLGNTMHSGDHGSQPLNIDVKGGQWTIDGGNEENYTGTNAEIVRTNATLQRRGGYYNQLAGGATTIPIAVEANGTLFVEGLRKAGFVNGTPIAQKLADSAIIRGITDVAGTKLVAGDYGQRLMRNGARDYVITSNDSRLLSGAEVADASLVGSCKFIAGVTGVSSDQLRCYYQDATGTPQYKDLFSNVFTGDITLNSAVGTSISLRLQENGVDKWLIQKDTGNLFRLIDSASSGLNRFTLASGGQSTINSGGSGAVAINPNNPSGTGGLTIASGTGTTVASINNSGRLTDASNFNNTNCASAASPAVCAAAPAGDVVIAAGATTIQVNTTIVGANSQIILTPSSASNTGTRLGVTCNATPTFIWESTRTNGGSFTIATTVAPTTNPECIHYQVIN